MKTYICVRITSFAYNRFLYFGLPLHKIHILNLDIMLLYAKQLCCIIQLNIRNLAMVDGWHESQLTCFMNTLEGALAVQTLLTYHHQHIPMIEISYHSLMIHLLFWMLQSRISLIKVSTPKMWLNSKNTGSISQSGKGPRPTHLLYHIHNYGILLQCPRVITRAG